MSLMLQRVALAIQKESPILNPVFCIKLARTAVEAMREPDEKMKKAGGDYIFDIGERGSRLDPDDVAEAYRDMIDEALK